MHVGEIWIEKQDSEDRPGDSSDVIAIRLIKYLDNDEWFIEYGIWDTEDKTFISGRDFFDAEGESEDEDSFDGCEEDELDDILTGREIFQDYVKVQ